MKRTRSAAHLRHTLAGPMALLAVLSAMTLSTAGAASAATIGNCTYFASNPITAADDLVTEGQISCTSNHNLQLQVCLEQLITGGWVDVVGSCHTSPVIYGRSQATNGKAYSQTCNRYYRNQAWVTVDGATASTLSSSYKGCTA